MMTVLYEQLWANEFGYGINHMVIDTLRQACLHGELGEEIVIQVDRPLASHVVRVRICSEDPDPPMPPSIRNAPIQTFEKWWKDEHDTASTLNGIDHDDALSIWLAAYRLLSTASPQPEPAASPREPRRLRRLVIDPDVL